MGPSGATGLSLRSPKFPVRPSHLRLLQCRGIVPAAGLSTSQSVWAVVEEGQDSSTRAQQSHQDTASLLVCPIFRRSNSTPVLSGLPDSDHLKAHMRLRGQSQYPVRESIQAPSYW